MHTHKKKAESVIIHLTFLDEHTIHHTLKKTFPRGTHKAYLPTEQLTSLTSPCVGNVGHTYIPGVDKIMETLRN
jgi:hypothetical protein